MRWLILFLCTSILPGLAFSKAQTPGASYFAQGAFCAVEIIGEEKAEGTISGTLNLVDGPPTFYTTGSLVPAQVGIGFGIHLDVAPQFSGTATVTTTHPPMGENGVTAQSWVTDYSPGAIAYNGFTFEYDYELVPGDWTISAESNGRLIYHAKFTVVNPMFAPPAPCGNAPIS